MRGWVSRFLVFIVAVVASVSAPRAGNVSLAWDPVSDPAVAGYRVHWGDTPGAYSQSFDAGLQTSAVIPGVADCQTWHFTVRTYEASGAESTDSNLVSGWARPTVGSTNPSSAEQGRRLNLRIVGTNFRTGASVSFADAAIVVNSVTVDSCTQVTADITVGSSAATGAKAIEIVNTDQTSGNGRPRPFGLSPMIGM